MKKILHCLVLFPILVIAQTQTQNYIKTKTYKVATATSVPAPTIRQANQNVTYYDGLGRPIQQVAHQQAVSTTGVIKDIVTPIEYDGFGRQEKDYLPYAPTTAASLDYKPNALTDVLTFYNTPTFENTLNPYSEKKIEKSPLNRVLKQAAPGASWKMDSGQEIKLAYQTNTVADDVKQFYVIATPGLYDIPPSLTPTNYTDGQLYKTITYDENTAATPAESNGATVEFKNKEGQVVLKRTYGVVGTGTTIEKHDTYYVYDQFGNLTFVLPPLVNATTTISNSILNDLCYQYKYDSRNRLVEKKLPGKQWEFIVYDKLNRVVATGPVFSPFNDSSQIGVVGWMITKYDAFNRPVYTGWEQSTTINNAGRQTKQNTMNGLAIISEDKEATALTPFDDITGVVYYSNKVEPKVFKLLTVNYYDDYAFSPAILFNPPVVYNNTNLKPKGLPTGSWTRVPTTLAATLAERSYVLYDAKARPITNYTTNYLGGYTHIHNDLHPFSGRLNSTITRHKRIQADPEIYIKEDFTYTDQDRLSTHTHQLGTAGTPQLLASNTYDELGQLISKKVGNTSALALQKVDYSYNIRGWLKGINNVLDLSESSAPKDLFAFKIGYDLTTNFKALYNGNISQTQWRTESDNTLRMYNYNYDTLNRLTDALFSKVGSTQSTGNYRENLSYDKNGNISSLYRTGLFDYTGYDIPIDDLYYSYNGNQLATVDDESNVDSGFQDGNIGTIDYTYDANGNMTSDKNKKIVSITYNHLNLPTRVKFQRGGDFPTISYLYNANGVKLQKIVKNGGRIFVNTTTDYFGGYQYSATSTNGTKGNSPLALQFFPHAEGYVKNTAGVLSYVYNYIDHLGNVRVSYEKDATTGSLQILEESNYYPFGMKHEGYNSNSLQSNYKYKYNGKELQDELGLNFYDYGARNYDPALGRWMNVDPLAETSRRISPYVYALNNPVYFFDPDGMDEEEWGSRDYEGTDYYDPGWIENKTNHGIHYEKDIRSQQDLIDRGRGDEKFICNECKYPRHDGLIWDLFDKEGPDNYEWIRDTNDTNSDSATINDELKESENNDIIDLDIVFDSSSSKLDRKQKDLKELYIALDKNQSVNIQILGNFSENPSLVNLKTKAVSNGVDITVEKLQLERAKSIQRFLISNGINHNRISIGNGKIENGATSASIKIIK